MNFYLCNHQNINTFNLNCFENLGLNHTIELRYDAINYIKQMKRNKGNNKMHERHRSKQKPTRIMAECKIILIDFRIQTTFFTADIIFCVWLVAL